MNDFEQHPDVTPKLAAEVAPFLRTLYKEPMTPIPFNALIKLAFMLGCNLTEK